ncbi:MAG: hypothetical protein JOZ42_03995 [Acetobacteraceae bacterium]|nr:hypothetical protein [Acetobacteraceae bacterium]
MHNKFIVLTKADKPVAVLTGSTNFTESALYGQLNCAHVVVGAATAQTYFDFWNQICSDPEIAALREYTAKETPNPPHPLPPGVTAVFSPRSGLSLLSDYGALAGGADNALFMTFAFGVDDVFVASYLKADGVLRFALMDKEASGRGAAKGRQNVAKMRKVPNTVLAVGQNIPLNEFDRWLKEKAGLPESKFVKWVHTKFMLIDPLSDDPTVVAGSANFSKASTESNHENMILVRGNTRVADIYLGEFMRQFSSYAFRDAAASAAKGDQETAANWRPQDLAPDDSWVGNYFQNGTSRTLRRVYFSGGEEPAGASGGRVHDGADKNHDHPARRKAGARHA